jgi:hypothetical protein
VIRPGVHHRMQGSEWPRANFVRRSSVPIIAGFRLTCAATPYRSITLEGMSSDTMPQAAAWRRSEMGLV